MDSLHFIGTATTVISLGDFTILTDPNFLRRGQRAYLGWGLSSARLTQPAIAPEAVPQLDAIVLSHLHGDHFDRVARHRLDRSPPVITTSHAAGKLRRWGFDAGALDPWATRTLRSGEESLVVTALPAIHARGLLGRMLPPVMGTMLEHMVGEQTVRRVYISGDTLTGSHVSEIAGRFPQIDVAVVHLGGTRVLFNTVTMDAEQGVDFVERSRPSLVVPVHYDDYKVFRSPLADFHQLARERGLAPLVRAPRRGEVVDLQPRSDRDDR